MQKMSKYAILDLIFGTMEGGSIMNQNLTQKLMAPFPFEEIEAKIQVASKEKPIGMAVFYIDSRAIQKRLDDAVGALNWSNHFSAWQDKAQICGISIFNEDRREWVTKHDGAENSDIEAIKGGLTDAFKRAAVLWGIGRYLYQIDGIWVEVEQRGKSYLIKDNQLPKLRAAYEAAVKRIFGAMASQPGGQKPTPNNIRPIFEYKIHSIKPAGKNSQLLELYSHYGELKDAYIRNNQEGIVVGAYLKNVRFEEKSGSLGKYNLIAAYEIEA